MSEHRREWASRWEDADVRIDGDPELQLATRFAIFHLLANAPEQGEAAIGARGLTGKAYRGHVFWDSDVYVLPFLAASRPRAARALLEYRLRRLPVAMRAARAEGRAGARFPWESAGSGREVTPARTRDGRGELRPVLTGPLEQHIVADVAWAADCYVDWTGDQEFAAGPGRELLLQTARWWASRIETDEAGRGHIRDVIGPDEYHEHVDDNAFTNVMARWNLRRAAAVGVGVVDDREQRRWLELAEAIVDGYEPTTGVYEQFAGFHALEPLLIAQLAPHRPVSADMLLGPERTRAAQVVKQPDVLMLHYLIPDEVAPGSLEANVDFYEPRTAHGSTLSPGVHAALLARAGRTRPALELLRLTAAIDLDDIGHMTAGGLHLAVMGSAWRALALGFAGLRPVGDALAIDPVLPPGWEALEVRVRFRDSRVRVRVDPDSVELTADPPVRALAPAGESCAAGPDRPDVSSSTRRRHRGGHDHPARRAQLQLIGGAGAPHRRQPGRPVRCVRGRTARHRGGRDQPRPGAGARGRRRAARDRRCPDRADRGGRAGRGRCGARPRRAGSSGRPATRGTHRAGGDHARAQARRRRLAGLPPAEACPPPPRAARGEHRSLTGARARDRTGSPPAVGGARAARPLAGDRARLRRPRTIRGRRLE